MFRHAAIFLRGNKKKPGPWLRSTIKRACMRLGVSGSFHSQSPYPLRSSCAGKFACTCESSLRRDRRGRSDCCTSLGHILRLHACTRRSRGGRTFVRWKIAAAGSATKLKKQNLILATPERVTERVMHCTEQIQRTILSSSGDVESHHKPRKEPSFIGSTRRTLERPVFLK